MTTVEYIWVDAQNNFHGQTTIIEKFPTGESLKELLNKLPKLELSNDGKYALHPCYIVKDPFVKGYLVLAALYNDKGEAHPDNKYHQTMAIDEYCQGNDFPPNFTFQQSYYIVDRRHSDNGWTNDNLFYAGYGPREQLQDTLDYHSVGYPMIKWRSLFQEHLQKCLKAGIKISGGAKEAGPSQWSYILKDLDSCYEAGGQLWLSRYILQRIAEFHKVCVSFMGTPVRKCKKSFLHVKFSTIETREDEKMSKIRSLLFVLQDYHHHFMEVYGCFKNAKINGKQEESELNTFRWAIADSKASINVPQKVADDGCGYIEDRRPEPDSDPYAITQALLQAAVGKLPDI